MVLLACAGCSDGRLSSYPCTRQDWRRDRSSRSVRISRAARAAGTAGIIRAIRVAAQAFTGIVKDRFEPPELLEPSASFQSRCSSLSRSCSSSLSQSIGPFRFICPRPLSSESLSFRPSFPLYPTGYSVYGIPLSPSLSGQSYLFLSSQGILAVPCKPGWDVFW